MSDNWTESIMDYWSVLSSIAFGVIVYLFFSDTDSVFLVIVLSWNNSFCLCAIHMPSLSVHQPFTSLGRHRWRSSTWYTCTLATQSFLWRSVSVGGYLKVHPKGWWRGGSYDGSITVGYVLPFDTPTTRRHPCRCHDRTLPARLHHISIY